MAKTYSGGGVSNTPRRSVTVINASAIVPKKVTVKNGSKYSAR